MSEPTNEDTTKVNKILRYIKNSPGSGLFFSSGSRTSGIRAFSNSDWASCPITRRSTSEFVIFFNDNLVSWQTKKQHTVARSSAEAEYRALTYTTCEIIWLRQLLKEMHINIPAPKLFTDISSATAIVTNPVLHQRTKHIEIDIHTIRDKVLQKEIEIQRVNTKENIVDNFTKNVTEYLFNYLRQKLKMKNLHTTTTNE